MNNNFQLLTIDAKFFIWDACEGPSYTSGVVLYALMSGTITKQNVKLFHGGGLYHIETSPLICSANEWTGFYMIETSAKKELKKLS